MREMRFDAIIKLLIILAPIGVQVIPQRAHAWVYLDPAGSCTTTRWQEAPKIKVRWPSSSGFSATEQDVIRSVMQQFNQLSNGKIYVYEAASGDNCTPNSVQPADTICISKNNGICSPGQNACAIPGATGGTNCTHNSCEVSIEQTFSKPALWAIASQELAHCFGLFHTTNTQYDWMGGQVQDPISPIHVGMTRDTMNGLNYLYPFGTNFYFGNFNVSSSGDTDILTRDNQNTSNTVPWYLTTQDSFGDSWTDSGQVITDFGNETTLAYVTGDFTGDGCPDLARGLCDGCDPGNGMDDIVEWTVKPSDCGSGFQAGATWESDFGKGEDYDQYRVGDFDGDGCDDVWRIRNNSAYNCTGGSTCTVTISWMLARRPNGDSCAVSGSAPNHFVTHGTSYTLTVSDRSAASAWPWVVGDFHTNNLLGCDDLAYGVGSQSDPRILEWRVLKANDSNSNGLCDELIFDLTWEADFGELGLQHVFAAHAGAPGGGGGEDLIRVKLPVEPGVQEASWHVTYSDGANNFTNSHEALADHLVTGAEVHWTGMVFGVGNFDSINAGTIDFITLRGANSTGAVKAKIAYRNAATGSWSLNAYGSDAVLPTAKAEWKQPTDDDYDTDKDNGGDDAKGVWWCRDDDVAYCTTCGCCPIAGCGP